METQMLERRGSSESAGWFFMGICAGVVLSAFLDPRRGAARRAMLRDKATSQARHLAEQARRKSHQLEWRARGTLHETRGRMTHERVDDGILVERVRAQLGRPVSHPHSVEVSAEDGCVVLNGKILASELEPLLERIRKVRGVRDVLNQLDVRQSEEDFGAQGPSRTQRRVDIH